MIETNRLNIYAVSCDVMEDFIEKQTAGELKAVYMEMLGGVLGCPEQWEWYTVWMIELRNGIHIGRLSPKGMGLDGIVEINYGISTEYKGNGYATEAVSAIVR